MNDQEFRLLVKDMRHNQREYFRTRNKKYMVQSKILERQVDKELEENLFS